MHVASYRFKCNKQKTLGRVCTSVIFMRVNLFRPLKVIYLHQRLPPNNFVRTKFKGQNFWVAEPKPLWKVFREPLFCQENILLKTAEEKFYDRKNHAHRVVERIECERNKVSDRKSKSTLHVVLSHWLPHAFLGTVLLNRKNLWKVFSWSKNSSFEFNMSVGKSAANKISPRNHVNSRFRQELIKIFFVITSWHLSTQSSTEEKLTENMKTNVIRGHKLPKAYWQVCS